MPCATETPIPNHGTVSTRTMERITIDDETQCVDAQIEPGAGDWIGYQVIGLTRIDAIIMGLLMISVLASFAGCVLIAIHSDVTARHRR